MARPIPISNRKAKQWNEFLTTFNQQAATELPQTNGVVDYSLLDTNTPFGAYQGGQDYYKKKFADFIAAKGYTGADDLKEEDFGTIQQLFRDIHTESANDPTYKTAYDSRLGQILGSQGIDPTTFDPGSTKTGKDNSEGWIGTVSRNFYLPMETGQLSSSKDKVLLVPSTFDQGDMIAGKRLYEPNKGSTGGVFSTFEYGGKLYEKGGKICYEDGGKTSGVEVKGDGELEKVSEEVVEVEGKDHDQGGVKLNTGDEVEGGEMINTEEKIVLSDTLIDPVTKKTYSEAYEEKAKELAPWEKRFKKDGEKWVGKRVEKIKNEMREIYDRQEKNKPKDSGNKKQDGGPLDVVDPPSASQAMRVKYFKVGDKDYTVRPGRLDNFLKEFPDAKEHDLVEGKLVLKTSQPVGQKKNTDVSKETTQSTQPDLSKVKVQSLDEMLGNTTKPVLPFEEQEVADYFDNQKKQISDLSSKMDIDDYNNIIEPQIKDAKKKVVQNLFDPLNLSGKEDYSLPGQFESEAAARKKRDKDNNFLAGIIIDEMAKSEVDFVNMAATYSQSSLVNDKTVQDTDIFKTNLDRLMDKWQGMKFKREDGTEIDTDKITDSQRQEIRSAVIRNYQAKTTWDENVNYVKRSVETALKNPDYETTNMVQFIKDQAVDKGKIPLSEEQWKPFIDATNKIYQDYAPALLNLDKELAIDNKKYQDLADYKVAEFTNRVEPEMLKYKADLEQKIKDGMPVEEANSLWDEYKTGIQREESAIWVDANKKLQQNTQMKLTALRKKINESLKGALAGTIFETIGVENIDKEYVKESVDSFYELVASETSFDLREDQDLMRDWKKEIFEATPRGEQFAIEIQRGVLQTGQGIAGFMDFLGNHEAGNRVNDEINQFALTNPNYQGPAGFNFNKMLDPDYWISVVGPMVGQQLLFLPLAATGAGMGAQLAGKLGLGALGTQALKGMGSSIATRPFNAMINSGNFYNDQIANGVATEVAAEKTANVFTDNMKLMAADAFQMFFAFGNPIKLPGLANVGVKVIGGAATEGLEEVAEGYIESHQDNPFQTISDFVRTPNGTDQFIAGAMGGLVMGGVFSTPDLASQKTNNNQKFVENVMLDMMSGPDMGKRYEELLQTLYVLGERGSLDQKQFDEAKRTLDFAYSKGKDIPVNISPEQKKQILSHLSDINQLEQAKARIESEDSDPTMLKVKTGMIDKQIREIEKQIENTMAGKEPMYFIGRVPYTKEQFQELIQNPEVFDQIVNQSTTFNVVNDETVLKQTNDLIQKYEDSKNQERVSTTDNEEQGIVEAGLTEGISGEVDESTELDSEEEIEYPETSLTEEDELSESERFEREKTLVNDYLSENPTELSQEDRELVDSLFYTDESGQMFDNYDEPTTIEEVFEKAKTLKQGVVHESSNGKFKFVREADEVVIRDSSGNKVEAQPYKSVTVNAKNYDQVKSEWEKSGRKGGEPVMGKVYKTKLAAPEGVTYVDKKVIDKLQQERKKAGIESGEEVGTGNFKEIAEKSNSPQEIKAAWEQEKSRLDEQKSTEGEGDEQQLIYNLVKGGISQENADIIDLDNKDGSVSVKGWKIFKTGQTGDIDTKIQAINEDAGREIITNRMVTDFIKSHPKGPHEFKKENESLLLALEDRYKQVTGYSITEEGEDVIKEEDGGVTEDEVPIGDEPPTNKPPSDLDTGKDQYPPRVSKFNKTIQNAKKVAETNKETVTYTPKTVKELSDTANKAWKEIENSTVSKEDAIALAEDAIKSREWKGDESEQAALAGIVAKELFELRQQDGNTLEQINDYDKRAADLLDLVSKALTKSGQFSSRVGKFMAEILMAYPEGITQHVQKTIDGLNDGSTPVNETTIKTVQDIFNELLSSDEGKAILRDYALREGLIKQKYKTKKEAVDAYLDAFLSTNMNGTMLSAPAPLVLAGDAIRYAVKFVAKTSLSIAEKVELAMVKFKEKYKESFDESRLRATFQNILENAEKFGDDWEKGKLPKSSNAVKSIQEKIEEEYQKRAKAVQRKLDQEKNIPADAEAKEISKVVSERLDAERSMREFEDGLKQLTGDKLRQLVEKVAKDVVNGKGNFTSEEIKRGIQQVNGGFGLSQRQMVIIDKNAKVILDVNKQIKENDNLTQQQIIMLNHKALQASSQIMRMLTKRNWLDLLHGAKIAGYFTAKTLESNVVSNFVSRLFHKAMDLITSPIEILIEPATTRKGTYAQRVAERFKEKFGKERLETAKEEINTIVPALKIAYDIMKTGTPHGDLGKVPAQYDLKPLEAWRSWSEQVSKNPKALSKANEAAKIMFEGSVGFYSAFMLRSLGAGDVITRIPELSVIQKRMADYLNVPLNMFLTDDQFKDWREDAEELSRGATYQQENMVLNLIGMGGRKIIGKNKSAEQARRVISTFITSSIIPFTKTPANLASEVFKLIPGIAVPEFIWHTKQAYNKNLSESKRYYHQKLAQKNLKYTAISVPLFLAVKGLIEAGILNFPAPNERERKKKGFIMNYVGSPGKMEVNVPGMKKVTFDVQKFGPVGMYLRMVDETLKTEDSDKVLEMVAHMLESAPAGLLENTFFTGINNLMDNIRDREGKTDWVKIGMDVLGPNTNIVAPNILADFTKLTDDDKYIRLLKDEDFMTEFYNRHIRNKIGWIPVKGVEIEGLKPKYNVWGQPIKTDVEGQPDWFHYMFDFTRSEDVNPEEQEHFFIYKNYIQSKDQEWIPPIAQKEFKHEYFVKEKGKNVKKILKVKLTEELVNEYQRILGNAENEAVTKLWDNKQYWEKGQVEPTLEQVKKAYNKAQDKAKGLFFTEYQSQLEKLSSKK